MPSYSAWFLSWFTFNVEWLQVFEGEIIFFLQR
jgi:hypothetical protein